MRNPDAACSLSMTLNSAEIWLAERFLSDLCFPFLCTAEILVLLLPGERTQRVVFWEEVLEG